MEFCETVVLDLLQGIKIEGTKSMSVQIEEKSKHKVIKLSRKSESESVNQKDLKHLQISFIDFGGHTEYVACSTLFMKEKGIFFVCFDAHRFLSSSVKDRYFPAIGTYLELVAEHCPEPIFFLVATQMDETVGNEEKFSEILSTTKESEIISAAEEHLAYISRKSSLMKSSFLLGELLKTSCADATHLETILQDVSSKLFVKVAIKACHRVSKQQPMWH